MTTCPLCETSVNEIFYQGKVRTYFRCGVCHLTFVPPEQFLSSSEEKRRYESHENSPEDEAYRKFLSRLFIPLEKCVSSGSHGLDFGSGPGPTLSVMFEEAGYSMALYDAFFAKDPAALKKKYNFITATEVLEHLHEPGRVLERLWDCLEPGGWFGIMTKLALDLEAFSKWHYKSDPTHVCFFSKETFVWLAKKWQASTMFVGDDVIIFQKIKTEGA